MSASKIVDDDEIRRWFYEGRTYKWMTEEYKRKYKIAVSPSVWGEYRRRKGLPRRIARGNTLIPWHVKKEHRNSYVVARLRSEARRREGRALTEDQRRLLDAWLRVMAEEDTVVHYEPDTKQGFFLMARRPGIDTDLIRIPDSGVETRLT